ncbi:Hypothetical protein NTJ_15775 [Nesidiocoris tenuis]|uniref:Uncharacterized protein n=1 Tax=Nesidiocoris tenuis TaxID=355587 RepID=A0ABN7BF20_9HEMI|nr:Hypothetical protein NTJ_15775 [Nesidiocoris tenuis]
MHLAVGGVLAKAGVALALVLASTSLLCLIRRGSSRPMSLLHEAAEQMELMERRAALLGEELAVADGAANAAVARRRAEVAGDRAPLFWPGCTQLPCEPNSTANTKPTRVQASLQRNVTSTETLMAR